MISASCIAQILDASQIEEVVGQFVSLRKRGTSLTGLCPFHQEKSPSFHVSVTKGIFKCFGCGKGGDSVQFLMDHERFSYPEALRFLADKYQIPVEETVTSADYQLENDDRESLYILQGYAKDTFVANLAQGEGKTIGLAYFIERGFRQETIEKFELGYSLNHKSSFSDSALIYGFKKEFLERSGLSFATDLGPLMDRFRGRVMFPIHNLSGKVIAFGGRILAASEKTAKYINSPESDLYHKSDVLYGLFQARKAIRDQNFCLLAEGYTDVISLHQSGIENVVSSSGTSLTKQQIKLISRFTQHITILYDGDPAGIKASLRGIDLILEEGLLVKVVLFPDRQDPDSFIRSVGGAAFSAYLQSNQKDFISFKTDLLLEDAQNDPYKKSSLVHDILESIARIPDSVLATVYTRTCSEKLGIEERVLLAELNKIRLKKTKNLPTEESIIPPTSPLTPFTEGSSASRPAGHEIDALPVETYLDDDQEEEMLRLLLNYGSAEHPQGGSVAEYIIGQIKDIDFENPVYIKFYDLIRLQVQQHQRPDYLPLVQSRLPEIKNLAVRLLSQKYSLSDNWRNRHGIEVKREEELITESVENCINHLKRKKLDWLIRENQREMKNAQTPEKEAELLSNHLYLSSIRAALSSALGVVVLK